MEPFFQPLQSTGEYERWANSMLEMLKTARANLFKIENICKSVRVMAQQEKPKIVKMGEHQQNCERRFLRMIGHCIDPQLPAVEAENLATRIFDRRYTGNYIKASHATDAPKVSHAHIKREMIDGFLEKLAGAEGKTVPSVEVLATMARDGYDVEKFASLFRAYLDAVFEGERCESCKRQGGTVQQKRDAIKLFTDWIQRMEAMGSDIGLDEAEIAALGDDALEAAKEKLLQKALVQYAGSKGAPTQ